jgi:subtilisin family serine protease
MENQKIENLLNVSIQVSDEERINSAQLSSGVDENNKTWELIVRYTGDLRILQEKYPRVQIRTLLNGYAVIIAPQSDITAISKETMINYVEKPKPFYFQLEASKSAACISYVQQNNSSVLTGKGVITAIIDTGINAANTEFRNADGSTRILNIWDQTTGIEYTKEEIDKALIENADIPGRDIIGHGSGVAAIACGNSGVAKDSDIIAVKLGVAKPDSFPRTTQLMEALDYVVKKAIEYQKPAAINLSFGNNYGDHTGTSLLESYINALADTWKCSICIGSGNEGLGATHAGDVLRDEEEITVELAVSTYETGFSVQIWKDYWDDFGVEIISPDGRNLGQIKKSSQVNTIQSRQTKILSFYGEPSPFSIRQEIYLDFQPKENYIDSGLWQFRFIPEKIVNGRFDVWLPAVSALNEGTGFTRPDSSFTYTIPSTAKKAVSVGAYDARTGIPAAFSGRGYIAQIGGSTLVKPEITAPGVSVRLPLLGNTQLGSTVTGTSYATPFVTGSAALLMEWGIVRGNDAFLYGEKLKAYLINGAKRITGEPVPSVRTGYGALCLSGSIPK